MNYLSNFKTVSALLLVLLLSELFAQNLDEGLRNLASQIVEEMSEEQKQNIAVIEFSNLLDDKITELGKYVSEELITQFFVTKKFNVVERQLLNKIIYEHSLNLSGFIDEATAKELGKILGVDAICSGTITDLVSSVKINARLISTETGSVFSVASTIIIKDETVKKLMSRVDNERNQDVIRQEEKAYEKTQISKVQPEKGYRLTKRKGNLIINGNFKKHWTNGWTRTLGDITKGSSKVNVVNVSTGSGKAVKIEHNGESYTVLYQKIPVIDAKLKFSASFQMVAREGPIIGFSGTGMTMISLNYYNESGVLIGKTTIGEFVRNPFAGTGLIGVPEGPQDTYKEHFIKVGGGWNTRRTINIEREIIDNLPGVNPNDVKQITVVLLAGATGSAASAELYVTDLNLEYK